MSIANAFLDCINISLQIIIVVIRWLIGLLRRMSSAYIDIFDPSDTSGTKDTQLMYTRNNNGPKTGNMVTEIYVYMHECR